MLTRLSPLAPQPDVRISVQCTVMTFEKPEAKACQPNTRGANDYFSTPIASSDGLRCCVARIVLRVQGATPTTMDPAP